MAWYANNFDKAFGHRFVVIDTWNSGDISRQDIWQAIVNNPYGDVNSLIRELPLEALWFDSAHCVCDEGDDEPATFFLK